MAIKNFLTFAGVSLEQYGVYISGKETHGAPARDYSKVSVPGRNGDLIFDNGRFLNIDVKYHIGFRKPVAENMEAMRNFLLSKKGYQRLEDSFHPDEFRLAMVKGSFSPSVQIMGRIGEADLVFDCKPQRFLKEGEAEIECTTGDTMHNPTAAVALPLVRVYGTGEISIGDETVYISKCDEYTDIDCELKDAYKGGANCNGNIQLSSGDFFHLDPGDNGIKFSAGISKVMVIPRWWRL